jgi:ABC-type lipoprotein release transport system permease subunit
LTSYLYQITPADPGVWVAAVCIVLVTAALGTFVPAVKATRVDPLRALRQD